MFDIGWSELLVVGLVALIVVGPKELPGMMRKIGASIKKIKQMAGSFQRQVEEAMDESEISELKDSVNDLKKDLSPGNLMGEMGDDMGMEDMDEFDLDKWNEQILEDEKRRLANPIRGPQSEADKKAVADDDGEGGSSGPEVISETLSPAPDVSSDKEAEALALEPVNENEPQSQLDPDEKSQVKPQAKT